MVPLMTRLSLFLPRVDGSDTVPRIHWPGCIHSLSFGLGYKLYLHNSFPKFPFCFLTPCVVPPLVIEYVLLSIQLLLNPPTLPICIHWRYLLKFLPTKPKTPESFLLFSASKPFLFYFVDSKS